MLRARASGALLLGLAGCALGAPVNGTAYTAAASRDRVLELPGLGRLADFALFSGYVTVDAEAGRALFYALAEAEEQPEKAPLILWLNGGPGCSSIGGGFLSELGPFYPTHDGQKLERNSYPWNKIANIVFLESPADVGFSYSNTTSDMRTGDKRTTEDSLAFLLGFLERFPAFQGRPFWVMGESYAGHYVPKLAAAILRYNEAAQNATRAEPINLKGMFLGNPWTDPGYDNKGVVDFWYSHGLVSSATRGAILGACNLTRIGPLSAPQAQAAARAEAKAEAEAAQDPLRCNRALDQASKETGNINIYSIYSDVCVGLPASTAAQRRGVQGRVAAESANSSAATPISLTQTSLAEQIAVRVNARVEDASVVPPIPQYDPCVDNEVQAYLNRPAVQAALHANTSGLISDRIWLDCNDDVSNKYSKDDLYSSMLPVYEDLLERRFRMLVYSGDTDTVCSFIGTRAWIEALGLPLTAGWRPWYSATGQVGGYIENFEGLTYATVRDAGHMVPYTQPERAFYLFSHYLEAAEEGAELFP